MQSHGRCSFKWYWAYPCREEFHAHFRSINKLSWIQRAYLPPLTNSEYGLYRRHVYSNTRKRVAASRSQVADFLVADTYLDVALQSTKDLLRAMQVCNDNVNKYTFAFVDGKLLQHILGYWYPIVYRQYHATTPHCPRRIYTAERGNLTQKGSVVFFSARVALFSGTRNVTGT